MSLSTLMSAMELSIFPQVAMVIFLVVFAGVLTQVCSRARTDEFNRAAHLPLDD